MSSKVKYPILAAVAISAVAVSQAQAVPTFTYDLRLAPSQTPTGGSVVDAHTATITGPGTFTLQLWGQITGDKAATTDYWQGGYVNVHSNKGTSGIITGGLTNTGGPNASLFSQSTVGTGGVDINGDGLTDWGATGTTSTSGWLLWNAPAGTPVQGGTATTQSQAIAGGWELLLGTFTLNITGVGANGTSTTYFPGAPNVNEGAGNPTIRIGSAQPAINYYPDNDTATFDSAHQLHSISAALGVTFNAGGVAPIPEPASLAMLGIGGLALLARRRK